MTRIESALGHVKDAIIELKYERHDRPLTVREAAALANLETALARLEEAVLVEQSWAPDRTRT